jgi:hypothetical protein
MASIYQISLGHRRWIYLRWNGTKFGTIKESAWSLEDRIEAPDLEPHADGLSVLVNDVERFQVFRPKDGQHLPDFT